MEEHDAGLTSVPSNLAEHEVVEMLAGDCILVTFTLSIILLCKERPKQSTPFNIRKFDLATFKRSGLVLTSIGVFFMEWGLFAPFTYLTSYALDRHVSAQLSSLLLSLINAGSVAGRWVPGYLSDKLGRFNILIVTIAGCILSNAYIWLFGGSSPALLIVFAIIFGFFSGSNVSLAPVCIGQLCKLESYGRYYATAYILVSISTLTSIPIAGEILKRSSGDYCWLILFTVFSYLASFISLILAKVACRGLSGIWSIF